MNLRRRGPNTTPVDVIVDGNEYAEMREEIQQLTAERDALAVENAELRAALERAEGLHRIWAFTRYACGCCKRFADEGHDQTCVFAILATTDPERGSAILAAGDEMATWLAAWVAEHPEACYSIAALNRWLALVPAQQRAPDHAYHSTATPHCGTVAGEGQP